MFSIVDDGLARMSCTLNFDSDLLVNERLVAYKYLVYNSQHQHRFEDPDRSPYEFLHQAPNWFSVNSEHVNRCLVIPRDKFKQRGKVKLLVNQN